jgi:hypothetical protein
VGVLALAACSSGGSKSSSTTSTTSASSTTRAASSDVCTSKDSLQSSIKALENPSLLSEGKSGLTSALDDVKHNLDDLSTAAKDEAQPQVDAVKSALTQLQDAIGNFGNGSLSDNIKKTGDAISKVGSTSSDLFTTLKARCPSS